MNPTTEQREYTPEQVERMEDNIRNGAAVYFTESAANMLRAYAATLKAAQGGVTEAMVDAMTEAWFAGYAMHRDSPIPEDAWSYGASRAEAEAFAHKYIHALAAPPAQPATLGDFVRLPDAERQKVGERIAAGVDARMAQPAERVPEGWVLVPREALGYVSDLLAERKYGPAARSPAHNARIVVDYWLTASPAPSQPAERVPPAKAEMDYEYDEEGLLDTYSTGHMDGWNDCRKAMLTASPAPSEGGKGVDRG